MKYEDLASEAKKAMENAYSPYSHFSVGAALLCRSGKVYTGCNIENASYTPTVCAERVAFFKALSDGEREFEAIAIARRCERECFSRNRAVRCMPSGDVGILRSGFQGHTRFRIVGTGTYPR